MERVRFPFGEIFSRQAFAKVEAICESRSNAELPIVICCSVDRVQVFFDNCCTQDRKDRGLLGECGMGL